MVSPIPVGAFHASRQTLARMLDFQEVARNDVQIDDALRQATANTEGYLHRGFFPWLGTRYRDWPDRNNPTSYRLRLDGDEFISLSAATSGGSTLALNNLVFYPRSGPPYNCIETSFSTNTVFQSGDTWQDAIALTGLWSGSDGSTSSLTTLAASVNASATTLTLIDGSRAGVGNVLRLGTEYVVVTGLTSATTGQTLQTPLGALASGTSVAVTTGSAFRTGEVITLDAEQMLVVDVTGNTLVVKRAWNGTVLATHTGSTIYAQRSLTVTRGACGSTAASHSNGDDVSLWLIPPAVQALSLAEAAWIYAGHAAGWQVAPGTTNRATTQLAALEVIQDLRKNAQRVAGRKQRARAV